MPIEHLASAWDSKVLTWADINYLIGTRSLRWRGSNQPASSLYCPTADVLADTVWTLNDPAGGLAALRVPAFGAWKTNRTVSTWWQAVENPAVIDVSTFNSSTGAKTYKNRVSWTNRDAGLRTAIYRAIAGQGPAAFLALSGIGDTQYDDSASIQAGIEHSYFLRHEDQIGTWRGLESTTVAVTPTPFVTSVSASLQGEVDPLKPTTVGWSWAQFSVGNGTSSVRWRYRLNGGAWSSPATIDVAPSGLGYETDHITGNPSSDTIEFELIPFAGNNLTGEQGTTVNVSGDLGEGGA